MCGRDRSRFFGSAFGIEEEPLYLRSFAINDAIVRALAATRTTTKKWMVIFLKEIDGYLLSQWCNPHINFVLDVVMCDHFAGTLASIEGEKDLLAGAQVDIHDTLKARSDQFSIPKFAI